MDDLLIPKFLQKLKDLEKFALNKNNDRNQIISKIVKLQNWLLTDRSLLEHQCCFTFMKYLYNSHGGTYKTFRGFRSWLQCECGMADVQITEGKIKGGIQIIFHKYLVESLAFGNCTQKKFHMFFLKLQEFALNTWGINFDEWHEAYKKDTNTIQ